MDSGGWIALAVMLGVAAIGGAIYYAIAWYRGVWWWLALLMVPVGSFILLWQSAQEKTGFDGLAAALPAIFLGAPTAIGGLIGGFVAILRKRRRNG